MDRRAFLRIAGFTTVSGLGLSGCPSEHPSSPPGRYAFPQGVASGDPRADSIVLWTRIVATGSPSMVIAATLQLARDAQFMDVVAEQRVEARAEWDFTVRHKITGLPPASRLYYRFVAGSDTSPVGRTLTAPARDARVANLRFAFLSCQDWSANHWDGMTRLLAEDIDLVVFLGDYIYEGTAPSGVCPPEASHPVIRLPVGRDAGAYQVAETLADYRALYRTYRSDPRLQALHARHPFIAIWDDHEFSDNCWQAHETYTPAQVENRPRRAAASQAWFEWLPSDVHPGAGDGFAALEIQREFQWGTLAHFVLTDERLHRTQPAVDRLGLADDPASGVFELGSRRIVGVSTQRDAETLLTRTGFPPTMLGEAQEQWWRATMRDSPAQWKLWCNEVTLMRLQADLRGLAPAPFNARFLANTDQWDGYGSARNRLLGYLREDGVANVVALTGDIHAFAAGIVMEDFDAPEMRPAIAEIVGAGLSSESLFYPVDAAVRAHPIGVFFAGLVSQRDNGALRVTLDGTLRTYNPWVAHVDTRAIGYCVVDVDAVRVQARLVHLADTGAATPLPHDRVESTTVVTVPSGRVEVQVATA